MKGAWKAICLAASFLTLVPQLSQARLNESLTQCRNRYGDPKQLVANAAGQIVGGVFESRDIRIVVELNRERIVTAIEYEIPAYFLSEDKAEFVERLGEIYKFSKSQELQPPTPFASSAFFSTVKGREYLVFSEEVRNQFDCAVQPEFCTYQRTVEEITACEQNLTSTEAKYRQLTQTSRVPVVRDPVAPINPRHAISPDLKTIYFLEEDLTTGRERHRFEPLDPQAELSKGQAALQQCRDFTTRYVRIIESAAPGFDNF
jgi:hypothetical protein